MEQHKIKVILTDHGYYDYTVQKKVIFVLEGINTKYIDHCITQIQTTGLCDNFSGATIHVSDYLIFCKSRDCGNNLQISDIGTHGGGQCGGRGGDHGKGRRRGLNGGGNGQGGGNGRRSLPTHPDVDACTNITKTYYHGANYRNLIAAEKQKVWQNQKRSKHVGSFTMSSS